MSKNGSRFVFAVILILLAMLIIPVTLIYARAEDGQEAPEVQEEVQTEEVTEPTEDEPSFDVMGWFRDELLPAVSTVLISVVGIILANARSAKPVQAGLLPWTRMSNSTTMRSGAPKSMSKVFAGVAPDAGWTRSTLP